MRPYAAHHPSVWRGAGAGPAPVESAVVQTATADPLIGRVLEGRYRIRTRVAVGGMSSVYAAVDQRLDREVAVKVMASTLTADPVFVDRFAHEARAAAKLSHVNAVSVYDQGSDADHVFLVMELVRGRTLRDLLRERGVLSPAEAVSLMEPVLAALASAHRAGLVHRDVKPENILLSDDGVVKVADFGLARAVESNASSARTGLMMGTVAYSSPEQFRGGHADQRSDVYSAGVVLFELLTGQQPHVGADAMSVAYAHVHTDVPAPSTLQRGIPPAFDDLVRRVTARDPAARPADAGVFLGELHDLRRELRLPVLPVPRRPRPTAPRPAYTPDPSSARTTPEPHLDARMPLQHTTVAPPQEPAGVGRPPAPPAVADPGSAPRDRSGRSAADASTGQRRRRRHPILRTFIGALILLLVAAGLIVGSWYYTSGRYGTIPDVRDQLVAPATALLRHRGFTVVSDDPQPSETVARGAIIETRPGTGDRLVRGRVVHLVASSGPTFYTVPDVRNQTQAAAQQALATLTAHGVQVRFAQKSDDSVKAGLAISTDPGSGIKVKSGASILVYLSTGPPIVAVPDVTGQPVNDATNALTKAGFQVAATKKFSDTVAEGYVIKQTPPGGGQAPKKSTVELTVSKGPDLVTVPQLAGPSTPVAEAEAAMKAAGLQWKIQNEFGGSNGLVVQTDPPAGTQVKRGSTVVLYVF